MQSEAAISSPAPLSCRGHSPNPLPLRAFILAKNEQANIVRCLDGLRGLGTEVVVLDSGSTDGTQAIASNYEYVRVENYTYVDHVTAYNDICTRRVERGVYALILDADMIVTPGLCREIQDIVAKGEVQVAQAPVGMWWNGLPLKHGSMYPPKPILFRAGVEYFLPVGHGEKLRSDVPVAMTRHELIHDDRKPYLSYLQSQVRYSSNFLARAQVGELTWRDKLRCRTPLMLLLVPLYSLIVRRGFLSGWLGLVYALDRLIAEAVFFRQVLASRLPEADKEERKNV